MSIGFKKSLNTLTGILLACILLLSGCKAPLEKEAVITIKHVLTMTSGLNDAFEYEADAGLKWYYNTPVYWKLFQVMETATGQNMDDLSRKVL